MTDTIRKKNTSKHLEFELNLLFKGPVQQCFSMQVVMNKCFLLNSEIKKKLA